MDNNTLKIIAKKFTEKYKITAGWSQEQHVGFMFTTIIEECGLEEMVQEKQALLEILTLTCNPSAFRQKLESAGILAKTEKGERATALANKYAQQ